MLLNSPWVPNGSLIRPRRPCFVHSSTGANHRMSSGLKNMDLTTAFDLWHLTGNPVRTIFLTTTLSGLQDLRDPVATSVSVPVIVFFLKARRGHGG